MKKIWLIMAALSLILVGCAEDKKVSENPKKDAKVEEKEEPVKEEEVEEPTPAPETTEPTPAPETTEPPEEEETEAFTGSVDFGYTSSTLLGAIVGAVEEYNLSFDITVHEEREDSISFGLSDKAVMIAYWNEAGVVDNIGIAGDKSSKDLLKQATALLFVLCSPNLNTDGRATMLDTLEFDRIANEPTETSSTKQVTFEDAVYRVGTFPEGTMMIEVIHRSRVPE